MHVKRQKLHDNSKYLDKNIFCALDVKTTGTIFGYHEACEIRILPLDCYIKPSQVYAPLNMVFIPRFPERRIEKPTTGTHVVSKERLAKKVLRSTIYDPLDYFEKWYESLNLVPGSRFVLLTDGLHIKLRFLEDLFGCDEDGNNYLYDFVDPFYSIDINPLTLFLNDLITLNGHDPVFWLMENSVKSIVNVTKNIEHSTENEFAHCVNLMNCYRSMCSINVPVQEFFHAKKN